MRKLLFVISLLVLVAGLLPAQNINHSIAYYDMLSLTINNSLPAIRGTWYFVDPTSGAVTYDGKSVASALLNIDSAYAKCKSGAGDGIVFLSRDIGTSVSTTSYFKKGLVWAKDGITVVGVCAPTGIAQRARIANQTVTTTSAQLTLPTTTTITRTTGSFVTDGWKVGMIGYITATANSGTKFTVTVVTALSLTVSETLSATAVATTTLTSYNNFMIAITGSNNTFINLQIWGGGAYVQEVGCLKVSGARNVFDNCNFVGGAGCTPTDTERCVELGSGAIENIFKNCTLGTDSWERDNTKANCELYLNGDYTTTARNKFVSCTFLSMANGAGTAHGAIKSAGASCIGRHMIFQDCTFLSFVDNLGTSQATVFIGTNLTKARLYIIGNSTALGYTHWAATGGLCVYTTMPAPGASAAGGLPTVY